MGPDESDEALTTSLYFRFQTAFVCMGTEGKNDFGFNEIVVVTKIQPKVIFYK